MVHLDYRDSRPIYAQIVDGFREQITGGWKRKGGSPRCRERAALSAATERSENERKNGCC